MAAEIWNPRILQLCPLHLKGKEGMYKQAGRKDKHLVENLKAMEKERPQELLGHIANFCQECLVLSLSFVEVV